MILANTDAPLPQQSSEHCESGENEGSAKSRRVNESTSMAAEVQSISDLEDDSFADSIGTRQRRGRSSGRQQLGTVKSGDVVKVIGSVEKSLGRGKGSGRLTDDAAVTAPAPHPKNASHNKDGAAPLQSYSALVGGWATENGAEAGGNSAVHRTQSSVQRNSAVGLGAVEVDFTADWKLDKKMLTEESHRRLTVMTAKLCLQNRFELKVLKAISVDCTLLPASTALVTRAKADTKAKHNARKGFSKEELAAESPQYITVYYRTIEFGFELCHNLAVDTPEYQRINAYWRELGQLKSKSMKDLEQRLLLDCRFARIRTCYDPNMAMLEMGIATMEDSVAAVWVSIRHLMVTYSSAVIKRGIAPKSGLERRVEMQLRRLRAWKAAE